MSAIFEPLIASAAILAVVIASAAILAFVIWAWAIWELFIPDDLTRNVFEPDISIVESSTFTSNVLFCIILPPPDNPKPAIIDTLLWLICSLVSWLWSELWSIFVWEDVIIVPEIFVVIRVPELELNVKFVPVLGDKFPVADVVKSILQSVSLDSSETVIFVAVVAFVTVTPCITPCITEFNGDPLTVIAFVSNVPTISTLPLISSEDASIDPNITLSDVPTAWPIDNVFPVIVIPVPALKVVSTVLLIQWEPLYTKRLLNSKLLIKVTSVRPDSVDEPPPPPLPPPPPPTFPISLST